MDFDEDIDPLDPRFVDAVLARARRRAEIEQAEAAAAAAAPTAATPTPPTAPATPAAPVAPTAPNGSATPPAAVSAPVDATASPAAASVFDDGARTATTPVVPAADAANAVPEERGGVDLATDRHAVDDASDEDAPDDLDPDEDDNNERRRTRNIVEWCAVAVGAVVVAFLIRAFLLQAFYIPSESMEPTLYENDRILVNKLSYKLHDVNRGDLVVFEKPSNEPSNGIKDLIKRTIALPNETIELTADGRILIDGRELNEPYLAEGQQPGPTTMTRQVCTDAQPTNCVLEGACTNPVSETNRCTLGEGFVWVMGDNRDHSHDSRAFGPINEDLIVGRAFVKVWPLSEFGFL